ncbi:MAG: translocation/assembly module TamB domain-containing protein [Deltaproteobacteria bacterium]|nr:translocation/assembly module TamB domain-containing protein [Deltaproteobacteria bacterium]
MEKKIDANGQITVTNGEFEGIVFEKIDVPFHLTEKALTLKTVAIDFPEQHVDWNKPFELRFAPNQIVMTGKPMNGLEIYVIHHNKEKSWEIKKIAWHDPADKKKQVLISGKYSTEALQLTMKGNLDFRDLLFFSQWFYEGSGPVALDLRTDGPVDNLKLFGKVSFNQSAVSIRAVPYSFEKLQGELRFNNKRIATDSFSSMMDGGSFQIKGWLEHANNSVMTACDLSLKGKELYFRDQTGTFRAEYDADLDLKFSSGQQMVSGKIMILSGRYTQDFNLIDEITQGEIRRKKSEAIAKTTKPIFLNLHVHNAGDFVIDNNVGEIEISTNLKIRGSSWRPQVDGSVEVVEGEIHYLGLDFEITSGFMEFRDPYTNPYMEVEGEKDIADAHLKARLYGRTENLRIELSGNLESGETLAQKDVISLILFGVTTTEQQANTGQRTDFGSSVATQQISAVLERPIARTTKLDIFRVETIPDENGEGQTRRLRAGKKVSDRVHLEFTSEVGREDALQTFAVEYWLTDFLILRGSRETEENVQLNIGVRFKAR